MSLAQRIPLHQSPIMTGGVFERKTMVQIIINMERIGGRNFLFKRVRLLGFIPLYSTATEIR
jgi:hypothetical protein